MSPPGTSPLDVAETTGKLDVAETADHAANHAMRWWILAVLGVAQLMVILDNTVVNIALPTAQLPAILEIPQVRSLKFPSWLRAQRVVAEVSVWGSWRHPLRVGR